MARNKNYFRQVTEATGRSQLLKTMVFDGINFSEKQYKALSKGLTTAFFLGVVITSIIAYLIS